MIQALDIDTITALAAEAGIRLTPVDRQMLERTRQLSERLHTLTPAQKEACGIPANAIPQLKIGWEAEFHVSHNRRKPALEKEGVVAYLDSQCPSGKRTKPIYYNGSHQAGLRIENNGREKPLEEAIIDYFQFRKELKNACDAKGWDVRRFGSHLHYSLCDQDGNALFNGHNPIEGLAKDIHNTMLEATYDCLPLMASVRQIRGDVFLRTQTNKLTLGIGEFSKDCAIRRLRDADYAAEDDYAGQNAQSFHYELRRIHPGPDNQPYLGCDPFIASTALLTGATALAGEGWKPRPVPVIFQGKRSYSQCCGEMGESPVAQAILGEELIKGLAEHLLENKHLYRKNADEPDGENRGGGHGGR